jgi:uncharacterized protein (TIGR03435 family)
MKRDSPALRAQDQPSGWCSNDRLVSRNAFVWYPIKRGWNIVGDNERVVGYPDWTKDSFYPIEAKAAAPVDEEQCRTMTRVLPADRLHLRAHEEKRLIDTRRIACTPGHFRASSTMTELSRPNIRNSCVVRPSDEI